MIVASQTQSHELKENRTAGLSSAVVLNSLKRYFLKNEYSLDEQDISDDKVSALLVYFGISYLKQNGLTKFGTSQSKVNDLLSLCTYLFDSLKNFLPEKIAAAMPPPSMASLERAKLFYDSNVLKSEHKEYLFRDIANLGFAYQIFSLGIRNKEALTAVQSANKQISRRQLISFTQLYTPNWVVDFILANTVLPSFWQWKEKFPSRYARWIVPEQPAATKTLDLATFNILDPACGAGQFLFSAFDLLFSLYDLAGYPKEEAYNLALENIYGADIDEKALWVAGFGLLCQSLLVTGGLPAKPANLIWSEKKGETGFLGSIDRNWSKEHVLSKSYNAVVINPPYLGRKCLSRELKMSLQEQYPDSSNDLCAAFLKRGGEMLKAHGRLGVITQSSILSIPSYKRLRNYLFDNYVFESIVHCGPGVFPLASGEKIDSVLLIAEKPDVNQDSVSEDRTQLIDLRSAKDKSTRLEYILSNIQKKDTHSTLTAVYTNSNKLTDSCAFGLPSSLLEKFSAFPKLADIAQIRQGLATTDNARFVRYHFDVDPNLIGSLWVPYIKGAGSEKFASDNPFVVKWGNNGEEIKQAVTKAYPYLKGKTAWVVKNEEFYFRPGLCFSFINKFGLAVRRLPAGAIFDVASSAIFADPNEEDFLLAYLNSCLIGLLTKTINQTINVQVGDLKKIPVFPFSPTLKRKLSDLGQICYVKKQQFLQARQIDLAPLRKTCRAFISAEQLEIYFGKYQTEQKKLAEELSLLQQKINDYMLQGVRELDILNKQEESTLANTLRSQGFNAEDPLPIYDLKSFSFAILSELVSCLLKDDDSIESIKIIPNTDSLAQTLAITDSGKQWLEENLGRSLEQIFCPSLTQNQKTKFVDINKFSRQPSRYFSFHIEDSTLFFSAQAIRETIKSDITDYRVNQLNQPLQNIEDWTSKDLFRLISTAKV